MHLLTPPDKNQNDNSKHAGILKREKASPKSSSYSLSRRKTYFKIMYVKWFMQISKKM